MISTISTAILLIAGSINYGAFTISDDIRLSIVKENKIFVEQDIKTNCPKNITFINGNKIEKIEFDNCKIVAKDSDLEDTVKRGW